MTKKEWTIIVGLGVAVGVVFACLACFMLAMLSKPSTPVVSVAAEIAAPSSPAEPTQQLAPTSKPPTATSPVRTATRVVPPTATPTATPTPSPRIHRIGEDVRVGDVRWKVLSAMSRGKVLKASQSRYPSLDNDKTTSGYFFQVEIEVENMGTSLKSVSSLTVSDSQGRRYVASSSVSDWIPEGKDLFLLENLNPNIPYRFIDIYEVPDNAAGLMLEITNLEILFSKRDTIDLGH